MILKSGSPDISPNEPSENIILFEGKRYLIDYLYGDAPLAGGNGVVFKINNENGDEYAIKICKFPQETAQDHKNYLKRSRFIREIRAFETTSQAEHENIVGFVGQGEVRIKNKTYDYYVMEKCDYSLGKYLELQPDLTIQQRVLLFDKILDGISYLHGYDLYHRDIKNDNVLILDSEPKICDLGLSAYRVRDIEIELEEKGEMIGPTGWFSPEATNKFLVENTGNKYKLDCVIGPKSDVFQLGKLFWYIIQGNLPLGQIAQSDLIASDSKKLYEAMRKCLVHSYKRRLSLDGLKKLVQDLRFEFGL
jgi:serine/threonine protein kinase